MIKLKYSTIGYSCIKFESKKLIVVISDDSEKNKQWNEMESNAESNMLEFDKLNKEEKADFNDLFELKFIELTDGVACIKSVPKRNIDEIMNTISPRALSCWKNSNVNRIHMKRSE